MVGENSPKNRKTRRRRERLVFVVLPLLVLSFVAAGLTFDIQRGAAVDLSGDLCPAAEHITGRAAFLVDLGKPLHPALNRYTGTLLRDVSFDLAKGTELRVFALMDDAENPRVLLARFCKPYDNADLQLEGAKDQADSLRDCDDLPAQLTDSVRTAARRFCGLRAALQADINTMAQRREKPLVTGSWLVEAIEAAQREFMAHPGPRKLYVYSDMLQHAEWYSHLDLDWTDWRFDDFKIRYDARTERPDTSPRPMTDLQVNVFYTPRQQLTALPRLKRIHQQFWQRYFAPAPVTFEEQPMLPSFAAVPQMEVLTDAERIALERRRLEQEIEATDRLIDRIEAERAALEKGQDQQQQDAAQNLEETNPP